MDIYYMYLYILCINYILTFYFTFYELPLSKELYLNFYDHI